MELVRAADRDRYLAALYAPEDRRVDLLALYAFNAEIAGIRDRVSQALPGEIRLQWWRDVIAAKDASAGAGHPVAEALLAAIERRSLPREAFQNYLDARIFDLYDDPMPTRGDLEGYCGETAAAIIQLSSIVLDAASGRPDARNWLAMPVARRRSPACCVSCRCTDAAASATCRKDILAAAGTSPEEFLAGDGGPNAPRAVAAMIALAREHLAAFERGAGGLPQALRPAFLPLALTHAQLTKMQGREKELLTVSVDIGAWRQHWLMFRRATKGWG